MSATAPQDDDGKRKSRWFDDRVIDFGEVDRAERHAAAWRRATFAALVMIFILASAIVTLALSRRTDVLVYAKDGNGLLHYLGQAGDTQPPSQLATESAIATWIAALRSIPDNDPILAQDDANVVFACLAQSSSAANDTLAFYGTYDPVKLNQKLHIHRSVVPQDVQVSQLTPLSYQATWPEHFYRDGQLTTTNASMTLTLKAPPQPLADPKYAPLNPNGILISDYQGHWSDVNQ